MTHAESRERGRKIAEAVADGLSPREAAAQFGVAQQLVDYYCKKNGVRSAGHQWKRNRRRKISEAVGGGLSVAEACKQFKVGRSTVRDSCLEYEVTGDFTMTIANVNSFLILRHLLAGVKQLAVASKCRVSRQRVHQIKQRAVEAGFTFSETSKEAEACP